MTEKRYKRLVSSIDYYYCIDTNNDKGLTEEDMLNRLNEQDERIKKLSEENEQLKQELYHIDKLIEDLGHEEMKRQYEEICGDVE